MGTQSTSTVVNGVFYTNSAIMRMESTGAELAASIAKFSVPNAEAGFSRTRLRSDVPVASLAEIRPLLTLQHERYHYVQTVTSPFGVLQWRLLNCIEDDVMWLQQVASYYDPPIELVPPMLSTLLDGVASEMQERRLAQCPEGWSLDQYELHVHRSLGTVIDGLTVLNQFLGAVINAAPLSMKAFVDLANRAFAYLSLRCDIQPVPIWTARDLDRRSYLPDDNMTARQVIEGSARFRECRWLAWLPLKDPMILDEWVSTSVHGVYRPAFELVLEEIGLGRVGQALFDHALLGAVDLISGPEGDSTTIFVEDVLPSWRLQRSVASARNEVVGSTRAELADLQRRDFGVPHGMGGDSAVRHHSTRAASGDKGWFVNLRATEGEEAVEQQYRGILLRRLRDAATLRLHDALVFSVDSPVGHSVQPLLEILADEVRFHWPPDDLLTGGPTPDEGAVDMRRHLVAFEEVILGAARLALLIDGDVRHLASIDRAMARSLRGMGAGDEMIASWSASRLMARLPGAHHLRYEEPTEGSPP